MADLQEYLIFTGILLFVIGASFAVLNYNSPGTSNPFDSEPSYTLHAKATVGATVSDGLDVTGAVPVIKEDTFRTCVKEERFSFSMLSPSRALSLTSAENVEATWSLSGQGQSVTDIDNLGDISKFTSGKETSFKAGKLPSGTYTVSLEAFSGSGSDSYSQTVEVSSENAVSECSSGFGGVIE